MNNIIREDFASFVNNEELFTSTVKLYNSESTLVYEGHGIYDKKPELIENEDHMVSYSGHKSVLTLTMADLDFMENYYSLKGYSVEITDNIGAKTYIITSSNYNGNVDGIFCYLKETTNV